jgi:hypothetical protein
MFLRIPQPLLDADAAHHEILRRITFSRHLNPENAPEARRAFLRGAEAPPFRYIPFIEADDALRQLDLYEPPRDTALGLLIGRIFDGTRTLVYALRDRSSAAFDALNRQAGWYPDEETLALQFDEGEEEDQPLDIPASTLIARLELALTERGLRGWRVEPDTVMAARVLVDGAKRVIRVHPGAAFRQRDLARLVVHEIDVHAMRSENGDAQPLRCFSTGLPDSLLTEEGLAMVAEERAGVASPGSLARQMEVVKAVDAARRCGFRELYTELSARHGAGMAWSVCLRVKRGLSDPGAPGVYAKDAVYLMGRMLVQRWLEAGGDAAWLWTGKVAVTDPVGEWLRSGWLRPGRVPPGWISPAEGPQSPPLSSRP